MLTNDRIKLYCEQKEEEKTLKKSISALGDELKQELATTENGSAVFEKYSIRLETRTTENINEEKMLKVLKDFWDKEHPGENCPFIRTRTIEYIDEDELESFMYKTKLPESLILDLDGCRTQTVTKALTYKIKKEN